MSSNAKKPIKLPQDHKKPEEKEKPKKYCPFKKTTDLQYQHVTEDPNSDLIQSASIEFFGPCIEGLCMAYKKGTCQLIKGGVTNETNN